MLMVKTFDIAIDFRESSHYGKSAFYFTICNIFGKIDKHGLSFVLPCNSNNRYKRGKFQ